MASPDDSHSSPSDLVAVTSQDPQFVIPPHPSMNKAVPYCSFVDRLVIEGPMSRRVVTGPSVCTVLLKLISVMNGQRSWDEIADVSRLSRTEVYQGLKVLFMAGALTEGEQKTSLNHREAYIARMIDATRVHQSLATADRALKSARVRILASSDLVKGLEHCVKAEGMKVVGARAHADLIIVESSDYSKNKLKGLSRLAKEHGIALLPIARTSKGIRLGPVAWPQFGPCLSCSAEQAGAVSYVPWNDQFADYAAAVVAHEVTNLLGRIGTARTSNASVDIDFVTSQTDINVSLPLMHCDICGPGISETCQPLSYEYETSVTFPPRKLIDPRRNQVHYESSSARLTFDFREFPGCETVELPPLNDPLGTLAARGLTLDTLGEILAAGFGIRSYQQNGKLKRWAPSGGNLGSPQAYLHSEGLPNLPDGTYAYYAPKHVLMRLPFPKKTLDRIGVQIVLIGEVTRVAKKYSTFGYRVVSLDSGVALLHTVLLAERYRIPYVNLPQWDEAQLTDKYSLSFRDQAVTGQIELYGGSCL